MSSQRLVGSVVPLGWGGAKAPLSCRRQTRRFDDLPSVAPTPARGHSSPRFGKRNDRLATEARANREVRQTGAAEAPCHPSGNATTPSADVSGENCEQGHIGSPSRGDEGVSQCRLTREGSSRRSTSRWPGRLLKTAPSRRGTQQQCEGHEESDRSLVHPPLTTTHEGFTLFPTVTDRCVGNAKGDVAGRRLTNESFETSPLRVCSPKKLLRAIVARLLGRKSRGKASNP